MLVSRPESLKRLTADLHWVHIIIARDLFEANRDRMAMQLLGDLEQLSVAGFRHKWCHRGRHVDVESMSKLIEILVSQFCLKLLKSYINIQTWRLELKDLKGNQRGKSVSWTQWLQPQRTATEDGRRVSCWALCSPCGEVPPRRHESDTKHEATDCVEWKSEKNMKNHKHESLLLR